MEVTREVILDLIPVYLSGEASPATRTLVEEHLARDPQLAERVRESADEVLGGAAPPPPPDLELRSVAVTRRVLARMRWLFGLACAFTAVGFSLDLSFSHGRLVRLGLALASHPVALAACLGIAAICWISYFRLRRRLRITVR